MNPLETERLLLGCVLLQPDLIHEVETVGEDHFVREIHRQLWRLMLQGPWRDTIELVDRAAQEQDVGGLSYVQTLGDACPSSEALPYYAEALEKARKGRALKALGAELQEGDPEELAAHAEEVLRSLTEHERDGWVGISDAVDEAFRTIQDRERDRREGRQGGRTGFRQLDRMSGGVRGKQVTIIAGRPGMGKTSLMCQDAIELSKQGLHVGIMSLEMPRVAIVEKLLVQLSGVDAAKVRDARLEQHDWADVSVSGEALYRLPIWIDDRPGNVRQIISRAIALHRRHGVHVLCIDYAQLIEGDEKSRSRAEEVSGIARSLQAAGKNEGWATILCAQLNRGTEGRTDKRPAMSDLKESGGLEEVADTIVAPWRQGYYDSEKAGQDGDAEILVLKARHGWQGKVACHWFAKNQILREIDER